MTRQGVGMLMIAVPLTGLVMACLVAAFYLAPLLATVAFGTLVYVVIAIVLMESRPMSDPRDEATARDIS